MTKTRITECTTLQLYELPSQEYHGGWTVQILDYKRVMLVLAFNITHFTKYSANILISNDHHKVVFVA